MICLKPFIAMPLHKCPDCRSILVATGFCITGMRNLANLNCPFCKTEFFGDLPAGQGLYTPILLKKKSGQIYDSYGVNWFSGWLADAYSKQQNEAPGFKIRKLSKVKNKVVLLNCLDTLYGHSLLKLLNAQHYIDFQPDFSLIVLLPSFLEWMLPGGTAEAWIVDLPLRQGTQWNNWLAKEIEKLLEPFCDVYLSRAFSHPHSKDFDIERFTGVIPFPIENFGKLADKPVITFIWREDRLWETPHIRAGKGLLGIFKRRQNDFQNRIDEQLQKVISFAETLRAKFSQLDFAVAGIGQAGNLPGWIADLRLTKLDDGQERVWCERYAKSHIVVGVHGSNMLLPSAHAGGVVELISPDRLGNYLQDILFGGGDAREILFRYRFVPHSTTPAELAELVSTMLRYEDFRRLMSPEFSRH